MLVVVQPACCQPSEKRFASPATIVGTWPSHARADNLVATLLQIDPLVLFNEPARVVTGDVPDDEEEEGRRSRRRRRGRRRRSRPR